MRHGSTKIGCVLMLIALAIIAGIGVSLASSRGGSGAPESGADASAPPVDDGALEIVFAYGSKKQSWVDEVTTRFNASGATVDAQRIRVAPRPMGSGECIDDVLSGKVRAHVISPASSAFIVQGNARARASSGHDLVATSENLVLSPVVIALWRPMAEALGWPTTPIGWSDILALAREPAGWAARGHPEWGPLRFGHTHPEYSNSGLIALFAELYAAAGKTRGLTLADLQ